MFTPVSLSVYKLLIQAYRGEQERPKAEKLLKAPMYKLSPEKLNQNQ